LGNVHPNIFESIKPMEDAHCQHKAAHDIQFQLMFRRNVYQNVLVPNQACRHDQGRDNDLAGLVMVKDFSDLEKPKRNPELGEKNGNIHSF
jgi:hypothetical protein